jgi:hypothetical protein
MKTSSCMARIQARKTIPKKLKVLSFQNLYRQPAESAGRTDVNARLLYRIHEMASKLIRSSEPLFYLEKRPAGQGAVRCTKVGDLLLQVASGNFTQLCADWPIHKFSPIVRGFMELLALLTAQTYYFRAYFNKPVSLDAARVTVDFSNRCASTLKKYFTRPVIKSANDRFRRSADDNFDELAGILQWISKEHTEVVVLRFDTGYREEGATPYKLGDPPRIGHLDEYRECRKRFHRWIKDKFGVDLLLCAWALEYGREKSFHQHYLVALKPRGNNDHVGLVEEIGRKWNVITKSLGSIHNCNAQRSDYRYPAIGLVRMDHPQVIIGLRYIASYITLAEAYVRLDLGKRIDAHGKFGNYPEEATIKPTRPRSSFSPIPIAITHAQARSQYVNF